MNTNSELIEYLGKMAEILTTKKRPFETNPIKITQVLNEGVYITLAGSHAPEPVFLPTYLNKTQAKAEVKKLLAI